MNSFLLLCDIFSFVFCKKLRTPKKPFKITWPLTITANLNCDWLKGYENIRCMWVWWKKPNCLNFTFLQFIELIHTFEIEIISNFNCQFRNNLTQLCCAGAKSRSSSPFIVNFRQVMCVFKSPSIQININPLAQLLSFLPFKIKENAIVYLSLFTKQHDTHLFSCIYSICT